MKINHQKRTIASIVMTATNLKESLSDATNLTAVFFFPPYVVISSMEPSILSVNYSVYESAVYFKVKSINVLK